MKLNGFISRNHEVRYFTEQILKPLSPAAVKLFGELSTEHPLTYRPDLSDRSVVPLHHLIDDVSIRTERVLLGALPGITFVHDINLATHGPEPILNSGFSDTVAMVREVAMHNETAVDLSFPERGKEYSREKHYAIRELSLSLLPIFTDPVMYGEYLARNEPGLNVGSAYLPWPADVVTKRSSTRGNLAAEFRIGFVGGVRLSARAHLVMRALSELNGSRSLGGQAARARNTKLFWVVRDSNERCSVETFLKEWGDIDFEIVVGRTPELWRQLLSGLDVAIHLHYGKFERVGPYLPISLGSGVPTIVSSECATWLPADAALFIRPGSTELGELRETLRELRGSTVAFNETAVEYVRQVHNSRDIRAQFCAILERYQGALERQVSALQRVQRAARAELIREVSPSPELRSIFMELGWGASAGTLDQSGGK